MRKQLIGRRSWTLNRNYITGLTYVIAGLAQLGQIDEARATLANLKDSTEPRRGADALGTCVYVSNRG